MTVPPNVGFNKFLLQQQKLCDLKIPPFPIRHFKRDRHLCVYVLLLKQTFINSVDLFEEYTVFSFKYSTGYK